MSTPDETKNLARSFYEADRLNRRQALGAFGSVSLASLLAACGGDAEPSATTTGATADPTAPTGATPTVTSTSKLAPAQFESAATCQVATQAIEGPYYFDTDSLRADIREDREGRLLRLGVRVRDAERCQPIENAIVDVWHCDSLGIYSGFESASKGLGGSGRTDDRTYLRGAQATNEHGIVEFKTIYPGWYRGRTTHIHAKVHLDKSTLLTTQLYTNQAFDKKVYAGEPYSSDTGRDTFNDTDFLYVDEGELTLAMDGETVIGLITLDVVRA